MGYTNLTCLLPTPNLLCLPIALYPPRRHHSHAALLPFPFLYYFIPFYRPH